MHHITGLVATSADLNAFAQRNSLHAPVPLNAGLSFLPLRDNDLGCLLTPPLSGDVAGFSYLCRQLEELLLTESMATPLIYLETDYFGGVGSQGAVVFREGKVIYGPTSSEKSGPINEALALLGVQVVRPAGDEFEMIGLGRHRSNTNWLESAKCGCSQTKDHGPVIASSTVAQDSLLAISSGEKFIAFRWPLLLIAAVLGLVTALKLGHKCDLGVKWFETHSLWMFPLLYGAAVQMLRRRPAWLAAVVLGALFSLVAFLLVPWYLAAIHPHGEG